MAKTDYKKVYKELFGQTKKECMIVTVPELTYLMIDGAGDPNTSAEYKEKISTLFGLAYTIKFLISKADPANDYVVPPLEGLWWCDDMNHFSASRKDDWKWSMMIMQPDLVTPSLFETGLAAWLKKNKLQENPGVVLRKFAEGKAVQVFYEGPYADEAPVIKGMHEYIRAAGLKLSGKHHEIYLNNPEKVTPAKLRTILRQPVSK